MKLENIKTIQCPICGCTHIISESVEIFGFTKADGTRHMEIREHSNGGKWEHRKFLCGTIIKYCPNFHEEEISGECLFSDEYREKVKKERDDKERLRKFIEENDIAEAVVRCIYC